MKDGLKFEATSSEGIFMGYAIHPEFMWKEEFFVASLKQLIDNAFDEPAQIMRVIKINRVDDIVFPLSNRPAQFKGIASEMIKMMTMGSIVTFQIKMQSLRGSQSRRQNKSKTGKCLNRQVQVPFIIQHG